MSGEGYEYDGNDAEGYYEDYEDDDYYGYYGTSDNQTPGAATGYTTGYSAGGDEAVSALVYSSTAMETVNRQSILASLKENAARFAEPFALTTAVAAALLNGMGWPLEPADVFLTDRAKTLKDAGLTEEDLEASSHTMITNETTIDTCPVCFDEIAPHDGAAFSTCQHFAHRTCWQAHLQGRGDLDLIFTTRCMLCRELVDLNDVPVICDGADDACVAGVNRAYLSNYLSYNPRLSVCTSATCDGIVHVLRPLPETAVLHCDLCGSSWCRQCRSTPHVPARCLSIQEWNKSNVEEGASLAFINQATKPCPKCHRPIQKNSGCNHMTCGQPCRYEFCWICMGDWKAHSSGSAYSCTRPPIVAENTSTKRAKEDLLRSYYESISSHKRSAVQEKKVITDFLSQTNNTYTHRYTPIFEHLRSSLERARALIWHGQIATYIRKLHFIDEDRASECNIPSGTEFRCGLVEGATEELSNMLDKCVGTAVVPGVLRGTTVDPELADPLLKQLEEKLQNLDGWCESVESDAS